MVKKPHARKEKLARGMVCEYTENASKVQGKFKRFLPKRKG